MNYAMIPINRRYTEDWKRIVRRVLISYDSKTEDGLYKKCKIIETDPYFKDKKASHQYKFCSKGFKCVEDRYGGMDENSEYIPFQYDARRLYETAYEFEAIDDKEAIKVFKERDF